MKRKLLIGLSVLVSLTTIVSSFVTQSLYAANSQSFVGYHGQLKVQGNHIVDSKGQAIALRGMSLYAWNTSGLQYYNATAIERLVKEWKCTVIRIPILPAQVSSQESLVKTAVDACIANGVYAIIDWHSMEAADASACSDFMKRMATAYGNTPNVIYETWNEPVKEDWSTIKSYHEKVISAIRSIDPDNVILCGTPQWDQNPQTAADNPITSSTNIAYTMHFYAATHKQWLRDNTSTAMSKGIAIFCSEYGTGAADGNGTMDTTSTQQWWDFMDQNNICSTNWSVSALSETTAAFNPGTSATDWSDSNLKPSGTLVKNYLVKMNTSLWNAIPVSTSTPTPTPTPSPTPTPTPTTTPAFKYGDLNGDNLINSTDYSLLKRYNLGLITDFSYLLGIKAADVNGDGKINSTDLSYLKRYVLGLISSFPAG